MDLPGTGTVTLPMLPSLCGCGTLWMSCVRRSRNSGDSLHERSVLSPRPARDSCHPLPPRPPVYFQGTAARLSLPLSRLCHIVLVLCRLVTKQQGHYVHEKISLRFNLQGAGTVALCLYGHHCTCMEFVSFIFQWHEMYPSLV